MNGEIRQRRTAVPASEPAPGPSEDRVVAAIAAIRRGQPVIVTDDERRENEGDLIMAAEAATTEHVAFFLRHTSGVICVAVTEDRAAALDLPAMVARNQESQSTAFTVTVDLAEGITTGISAADRALTVRALADPESTPESFNRPGHIFPLQARTGGVLKRAGHTEAAVDLAHLAGLKAAGMLSEIVTPDKADMARRADLARLAAEENLQVVSIAELVRYRLRRESLVRRVASARLPTRYGDFVCHAWQATTDETEHLALVHGALDPSSPTLVRVHSECLTGDVFHSERCDCGAQLDDALRMIVREGAGVVLYLRGHEGRGIGLGHKLRSYALQEAGHDTVDANLLLGLPVDARDYGIGAQMLADLGICRLRLMTNNPRKYDGLAGYGLEIVERVPLPPRRTAANARYLDAKRTRMGHMLSPAVEESVA